MVCTFKLSSAPLLIALTCVERCLFETFLLKMAHKLTSTTTTAATATSSSTTTSTTIRQQSINNPSTILYTQKHPAKIQHHQKSNIPTSSTSIPLAYLQCFVDIFVALLLSTLGAKNKASRTWAPSMRGSRKHESYKVPKGGKMGSKN